MNKTAVLKLIDEATLLEEEAVPIYADHISTALAWSGISQRGAMEIRDYLVILKRDSEFHAKAFRSVKDMLTK